MKKLIALDREVKLNVISIVRYQIAALLLKYFSSFAFMRRLYRFAGNSLGDRHTTVSQSELERGIWLCERFREEGFSEDKKNIVLELGTGWTHFYAIFIRLFFKTEIVLFDIHDNRNLLSLKNRCAKLLNALLTPSFLGLFQDWDLGNAKELLGRIIAADGFNEVYRQLNMSYLIETQGRLDALSEDTFDVIFSVDVLEHVKRESFSRSVADIYRVLKPGGISIHQIGIDDHLAHYAPGMYAKNYLRYSTSTWKLLYENQLQYFNRLQLPEILSMFDATGFKLQHSETEEDASLDNSRVHFEFRRFDKKTLNVTRAFLVHRKPL